MAAAKKKRDTKPDPAPIESTPEAQVRPAESAAAPAARLPIVGVGASAGGLEAFTELLQHLPPKPGLALVFVQHLDPQHESNLPEILRRATKMPVHSARDGMILEANQVYVIPPDRDLALLHGAVSLTDRPPRPIQHLPIDHFFRSLAADQGPAAVGVVLSGTGSDGTLGLRAIRAEGGITFAQDQQSARYGGMPAAAVSSGQVDFVLPPKEIAHELVRIGHHPAAAQLRAFATEAEVQEPSDDLNRIFVVTRQVTGVDFSHYKPSTVRRRIGRRMLVHKIETLANYLRLLQQNRGEVEALLDDMLINVTSFFRDPEAFDTIKDKALPKILENRPGEAPVRVWVPACSTGEEAYSVAIATVEYFEQIQQSPAIQVFATDLSEPAIEKARSGLYPESIVSDISRERLRRFFSKQDGGYQISKTIRDMCVFARQDVTRDPPFSRLDLISCRNLLIYMGPALQSKIIPAFHYALSPLGFLLLGTSETIGRFSDLFSLVDKKHKLYCKKPTASHPPVAFGIPDPASNRLRAAEKAVAAALTNSTAAADLERLADQIILRQYAPAGVVVNSSWEIVHFRGQTGRYLEPAPGQASLNLMKMAREGLALELRAMMHQLQREHRAIRRDGVRLRHNGNTLALTLELVPMAAAPPQEPHFLVLFREVNEPTAEHAEAAPCAEGIATSPEYRQVVEDLAATKEALRMILEERDATTEELRAANEEIQSSNEELQSINEELETAKEELQSTNEELTTVNEELENRNAELSRAINDYNNLLNSVEIPLVMLDSELRIRMFTPSAQNVLTLIPGDRGRPIGDLNIGLAVEGLEHRAEQVIQTLQVADEEVQGRNGRWYSVRIRPYRTADNRIEGAVVALVDVTDKHASEGELRRGQAVQSAHALAGRILAAMDTPWALLDNRLRIATANEAFCALWEIPAPRTEGQPLYELGIPLADAAHLRTCLEEVLAGREVVGSVEIEQPASPVPRRLRLTAQPLGHEPGQAAFILLAAEAVAANPAH